MHCVDRMLMIFVPFLLFITYFLVHKTHRPKRRTVIFSLGILEKKY